tara:strand:+ start:34 stop:573 length:540 start_codon:yes stop_codon:yes gene_type:complete
MLKDNLTICPRCGSDACYEQELGADYKVSQCYGCGFTTNTLMTDDSPFLKEQIEVLPELYKDLIFSDDKGHHWMPSAINNPESGMVFADGTSLDDWKWSAIKAKLIPESEKEKFPIPGKEGEFYKYKMDMDSLKKFAERDFIEALDYIGAFNTPEETPEVKSMIGIGSSGRYPSESSEK